MCTFSTFRAGFCTRQAYNQDRLMCSSCAIISRMHSAEHAYTVQSMHAQCRACMHSAEHACTVQSMHAQCRACMHSAEHACTVQSMHAQCRACMHSAEYACRIQHPCVLYVTSHTMKSHIYKLQLLFESGICIGVQFKSAASIREWLLYKTLW